MAREESAREDLLREATALVERIELVMPAGTHVVAGFRQDGALSLFFDDDPVYQFNAAGQLRRAFAEGRMLKAVRGNLIALNRVRTAEEVQLVQYPLSNEEQHALLATMSAQLTDLAAALRSDRAQVVGQVPPDANILGRLQDWLNAHGSTQEVATRPNA
jgi:hypothetical protein